MASSEVRIRNGILGVQEIPPGAKVVAEISPLAEGATIPASSHTSDTFKPPLGINDIKKSLEAARKRNKTMYAAEKAAFNTGEAHDWGQRLYSALETIDEILAEKEAQGTGKPGLQRAQAAGRLAPIEVQDGKDPGRTNPGDGPLTDPLTHMRLSPPDRKAVADAIATLAIGEPYPDTHTTFFDKGTRQKWLGTDPDNSLAPFQLPMTTEPSSPTTRDWKNFLLELSIEAAIAESKGRTVVLPPRAVRVVEGVQRPREEQFPLPPIPTLPPHIKAALEDTLTGFSQRQKVTLSSPPREKVLAQLREEPAQPEQMAPQPHGKVSQITEWGRTKLYHGLRAFQDFARGTKRLEQQEREREQHLTLRAAYQLINDVTGVRLSKTASAKQGRILLNSMTPDEGLGSQPVRISFNIAQERLSVMRGDEGVRIIPEGDGITIFYSMYSSDPSKTSEVHVTKNSDNSYYARQILAALTFELIHARDELYRNHTGESYKDAFSLISNLQQTISREHHENTPPTRLEQIAAYPGQVARWAREEVGKAIFEDPKADPLLVGVMKVATPIMGAGIWLSQAATDIFSLDGDDSSPSTQGKQITRSIPDRLHDAGEKALRAIDWASHATRLYDVGRWMAMDQRDYLDQRIALITRAMQEVQQEKSSQDDPQLDQLKRVVRQAGIEGANRTPIPPSDPRANALGKTGPAEPLWPQGALNIMSAKKALEAIRRPSTT